MSAGMWLLLILIAATAAVFPAWKHSLRWGFRPSAGVAILAAIVLALLVTRVI